MLEQYCRSNIWYACKKKTGYAPEEPLVCLKGEKLPYARSWDYEGFYDGEDGYAIIWDFHKRRSHDRTLKKAVGLFSRNGQYLCDAWIKDKYGGDWRKAILEFKTFSCFFKAFEEYFIERKNKFMDKTKDLIQQMNPELKTIKTIRPNSHGGVANLLRVLTRTMNEQGSSIRTIAKVQFQICIQAGIMVPEDFITDVLTAADMDPNIWKHDENFKPGTV